MNKYIISVLVENHFGVLGRVAGLFARRGYNIESLSVGVTEDETLSRITILVLADEYILSQITKQLQKSEVVKKVAVLSPEESVVREFVLIKVRAEKENRMEIFQMADVFRGKIVDVGDNELTVELTGDNSKIDAFLELARPYGILEISRTGLTALQRGGTTIYD